MADMTPILVTGAPRSGSTWVGRTIAKAPSVHYVHEPFNISGIPCSCGVRFDYWFFYISKVNGTEYQDHIRHVLGSCLNRFHLRNMIKEARRRRRVGVLINHARSLFAPRPVVKDPLALCSAEWLASAFGMKPIIVIRHPAAFANSYKRLNWSHPFAHFLSQPLLMKERLFPFEAEIREFATEERDIVDQAALLWKLLHFLIQGYQQAHPDWCFVRHEDLVQDPLVGFQAIFAHLGLEFSDQVALSIREHQEHADATQLQDPYSVRRSSDQVAGTWRLGLAPQEIEKVRARVEGIASSFYASEEW
jgi:hypothetical protein